MKAYEGVFVFPPDSTPEVRKTQLKNLEDLITRFGGSITERVEIGRKPLGYPVRKHHEGFLWVADYKMEGPRADEFRKALELQEDLIKHMIIRKDPVAPKKVAPPKPAAPEAGGVAPKPPARTSPEQAGARVNS